MICHQKIIREERAAKDLDADLFGRYWEHINRDINNAKVDEISSQLAKTIILKYEWLKSMPAIPLHCYGIFYDNHLGGVAVYSPDYIENLGVWDSYGYTGKIILLSRGACVHWAHPHSASKLISTSIKMLPEKYRVVTATVDREAGEIGTIYQACNFHYAGVMSKGGRGFVVQDGKKKLGHSARRAREFDSGLKYEQQKRKERYFYFRGNKKERLELIGRLISKIKPYPKRTKTAHESTPTSVMVTR